MVKRKFSITAKDDVVGVKIGIDTSLEFDLGLSKVEQQKVVRDLADSLVRAIPGLVYTGISIVDVKVKNV